MWPGLRRTGHFGRSTWASARFSRANGRRATKETRQRAFCGRRANHAGNFFLTSDYSHTHAACGTPTMRTARGRVLFASCVRKEKKRTHRNECFLVSVSDAEPGGGARGRDGTALACVSLPVQSSDVTVGFTRSHLRHGFVRSGSVPRETNTAGSEKCDSRTASQGLGRFWRRFRGIMTLAPHPTYQPATGCA